jgi:DNA polymerase-1
MEFRKKLFLLDAYALIFRAYYAFINRQMLNSKGLNTSAIFGFTATLEEILRNEKPTHIAVVFDPPGPTFRHEKYTEYKANREETPEDIKKSVPIIKSIIQAFNIPVIEVMGYEADDVIGTLSRKAAEKGYIVYMMTPDKDYAQLVTDNIFMYKPRKGGEKAEILGVDEVNNQFGIKSPRQVIDILALWGDSSDNIPGAPGIGEVTARKLIAEYGSVEGIFKNADHLKGKQKESIINYSDRINLAKELVTICLDTPVDFHEKEFELKNPDIPRLSQLFNELEFRNLADRIIGSYKEVPVAQDVQESQGLLFTNEQDTEKDNHDYETIHTVKHSYHTIKSDADARALISELNNLQAFCFDTETTNIDPLEAELVGVAFSFRNNEAYYVPFPADKSIAISLLKKFEQVFANQEIEKIGQNLKYDIQVLNNYQIAVRGSLFDTMLAHYLLHPESRHNLNYLSGRYLNYKPVAIEELIGKKGQEQGNMRNVPVELISDYACEDADLTWQLSRIFCDELRESGLLDLARNVEFPLIQVLADMERAGFEIDTCFLEQYGEILKQELVNLEEEIFTLAAERFNISSPRQLGVVLFEKLNISGQKRKTRSQQYSTSEDVLSRLIDKHPVISKVLDHRALKKLLSTYVEALPKMISPATGKIHTSFNQAITATGRLSSNNPNLQNIPIREERGREVRKAFIPESSDNLLVAADYSQIELRLMAHMSDDENLKNAFLKHEDIHVATAAKIFNVPADHVSREMRSQAKTANFGIIYGISAFGLSQRLNIGRAEAKILIDGYFKSYPKVKEYIDRSIIEAKRKGYVTTLLGRKRYLPDIQSRNAVVRGFAERNAINAPLQGSAADIIKIAMIRIHDILRKNHMKSKMILQVHDELVFDVNKNEIHELIEIVKYQMEHAYPVSVPLLVDVGSGSNWLEAH